MTGRSNGFTRSAPDSALDNSRSAHSERIVLRGVSNPNHVSSQVMHDVRSVPSLDNDGSLKLQANDQLDPPPLSKRGRMECSRGPYVADWRAFFRRIMFHHAGMHPIAFHVWERLREALHTPTRNGLRTREKFGSI